MQTTRTKVKEKLHLVESESLEPLVLERVMRGSGLEIRFWIQEEQK